MSNQTDRTTLVSLFHTEEQATRALRDLQTAGIPQGSIQTLTGNSQSSAPEQALGTLKALSLPAKDLDILSNGLKSGGTLLIVRAEDAYAEKAEDVFTRHNATEIDERTIGKESAVPAQAKTAAVAGDTVIPIVEEELSIGKRTVERGGVRVFSRVVETPVEETVVLHEERATLERHAVNRPISQAEAANLQNQTIEVQEMGEEAVVGKTARVVEEVHVNKTTSERTEQVKDTLRRTEVDVEQLPSNASEQRNTRK